MSKFSELVKLHRMAYHETQAEYAKRFGFETGTAVSLWESGLRKVPEQVLEAVLFDKLPEYEICDTCRGAGVLKKESDSERQ